MLEDSFQDLPLVGAKGDGVELLGPGFRHPNRTEERRDVERPERLLAERQKLCVPLREHRPDGPDELGRGEG